MSKVYELYFFVEKSDDGTSVISPMCVECHKEKYGYLGWHYKGELASCDYFCKKCNKVIKEEDKNNR